MTKQYKAGDVVAVKLSASDAENFNDGMYACIAVEQVQEEYTTTPPPINFDELKVGDALEEVDGTIRWYVCPDPSNSNYIITVHDMTSVGFVSVQLRSKPEFTKRRPEEDYHAPAR